MTSQHYQETHARLQDAGQRLLRYVQAIRSEYWSQGDDTASFDSIIADVERGLDALREQRYQVAAIAAMKAGKSTFLNALIGADVLASESEACTVCRTDVRPIAPGETPRLLEYREGSGDPVTIAEGDAATIRQQFLERTHLIRATGNRDRALRFELEHPIAALSHYPALTGFTLVDTPGPNEWSVADFDTVALKETALAALRNCDAILFILDYSSFKDNTNSELLQELIEQRQEFLAQSRGAIYFILNKIDRKTEDDRPIEHVVEDLQRMLQEFGIPQPEVYPASAWQGLLAKLIASDLASETHLKNFKRFFSGRYARETEEGDLLMPSPQKVAPQALADSAIPEIEAAVLRTVVVNSGWNLLRDVLAKLEKSATGLEDIINARIGGWTIEVVPLRQRMEDYKRLAKTAIVQIRGVKKLVEKQERKLVAQFKWEIADFAERAKLTIQREFEMFAQYRFSDLPPTESLGLVPDASDPDDDLELWPTPDTSETSGIAAIFPVPQRVADSLKRTLSHWLGDRDRPYQIRCDTEAEVEQVKQDINRFCAILIKDWWTATQDKLSRQGTQIRQELVAEIRTSIQQISDELSAYLGEALDIAMNINPIQMLVFDFQGIDTQVQKQTENYTRWTKERKQAFCRDYEVDIQVDDRRLYYEIDLRQTVKAIAREIDAQTMGSLAVVEKVIVKQVADDFSHAEQQINDYINRFLVEFDRLLREREQRETEMDDILADLNSQLEDIAAFRTELADLGDELISWQPS